MHFTLDELDELEQLIGEISTGGHPIDGTPAEDKLATLAIQESELLNKTRRGVIRFAVREFDK